MENEVIFNCWRRRRELQCILVAFSIAFIWAREDRSNFKSTAFSSLNDFRALYSVGMLDGVSGICAPACDPNGSTKNGERERESENVKEKQKKSSKRKVFNAIYLRAFLEFVIIFYVFVCRLTIAYCVAISLDIAKMFAEKTMSTKFCQPEYDTQSLSWCHSRCGCTFRLCGYSILEHTFVRFHHQIKFSAKTE